MGCCSPCVGNECPRFTVAGSRPGSWQEVGRAERMSCGQTDVEWFVKVARDSSARGSGGIGIRESKSRETGSWPERSRHKAQSSTVSVQIQIGRIKDFVETDNMGPRGCLLFLLNSRFVCCGNVEGFGA